MLEKLFKLHACGANVKTEIAAGVTTFMTVAYIIFINPYILEKAGLPFSATMTATCVAAGICTIIMGLYTNYPFVMASGVALSSFLVNAICVDMGLPWQTAMAIVFIQGVIIAILVLTKVREWIIDSIPLSLKLAITVGVGLFLAFTGLKDAGIIISHPDTLVVQGNLSSSPTIVALIGLILLLLLISLGIKGGFIIGIILTALIGIPFGVTKSPDKIIALPSFYTCGSFVFDLKEALSIKLWTTIFAFLIADFFGTIGAVVAISSQARFLKPNGSLPKLKRILFIDSLGSVLGGVFSASSVTTCIESSTGIAQGGRTGLTSVLCGVLFLLSIFFSPLIKVISGGYETTDGQYLYPVVAPILIVVGILMMKAFRDIPFEQFEEAVPALITILMIPLTFSIPIGIGWGFISYTLIKIFVGKAEQLHPLTIIISCLFAFSFSPWVAK